MKVNFPNGEIPWTELSRFDVNHTYRVMFELLQSRTKTWKISFQRSGSMTRQPEWDEPKIAFALPG